ncbi:MAG: hypothetical protein EAZ25_22650 [Oscillatoriales cyanobacterium]|nr:MAG: hypothetical protein EAZ86_29480 [Oscillatoriales cyanobacterium]TAG63956.1 MAG: hypothetical protein EAZ25_22650 [Oscillatoriales cyanobacterium]
MSSTKERKFNNLHIFVGWASRPSFLDRRDAHPRIIKIVSYLILIPNLDIFKEREVVAENSCCLYNPIR